jgi:hypothetical protein
MSPLASWLLLLTSICAACLAATCVVVCLRLRSAFCLMASRAKEWGRSVESFESRMKALEERYASVAKRENLNARRDPVTGRSARTGPESKAEARLRLGLIGANAARAAHTIHLSGGLKQ